MQTKLTESEETIMKAIWDCHKATVTLSEVFDQTRNSSLSHWKFQTVSTFVKKLVQKEYLQQQRDEERKTIVFMILVSEYEYNKNRLHQLFQYLYKGDANQFQKDVNEILSQQNI